MKRIVNWTARRSGAQITVTGQAAETGAEVKLQVDKIESGKPAVATDNHGEQYEFA